MVKIEVQQQLVTVIISRTADGVLGFSKRKLFIAEISVDHGDCEGYPNEDSSERCKY